MSYYLVRTLSFLWVFVFTYIRNSYYMFSTGKDTPTQDYFDAYRFCQQYGESLHFEANEPETEENILQKISSDQTAILL